MMDANLIRWAKVRGLKEGKMQTGRVEGPPNESRDGAQRPQDYGFAGNPVDGEGLRIEAGGHTVIIRMDRIAERPQLAAYEVAVWHKEGHMVRLRSGRVVQIDCDDFIVNATNKAQFNTPLVQSTGDVKAGAISLTGHVHGTSGPPS